MWSKFAYLIYRLSKVLYSILYFVIFKLFYREIKISTYISFSASIRNKHRVSFGNKVRVNRNVNIWCVDLNVGNNVGIGSGSNIFGNVVIGNHVMIAPNTAIIGGGHGVERNGIPMKNQKATFKGGIQIHDDVWIGANSVILDGVIIAKGTIIGAGSVVTKSTESYGIYVGSPAKFLMSRE